MLPLKLGWLWSAVGWLFLAGVVTGSLLPEPLVDRVELGDDKILHASTYGALMLWFGGLYPRRAQVRVAAALLLLGIAIELAQSLTATRSLELADIGANGSGILAALVLSVWLLAGWCQRLERRVLAAAG